MKNTYKEAYRDLLHGTTEERANQIIKTQKFIPSKTGWCGNGVYFYDIRAKAYWSAWRTCNEEKRKTNRKCKPTVVLADTNCILRKNILDLRAEDDLKNFISATESFLIENKFDFSEEIEDDERITKYRAALLDYYCLQNDVKIVIGCFKKENIDENNVKLADKLNLVVGIETIYCVKDNKVICNIRGGIQNEI